MYSLESVYSIVLLFGEGPQFAVVEEHTCNIYSCTLNVLILTALLISLL